MMAVSGTPTVMYDAVNLGSLPYSSTAAYAGYVNGLYTTFPSLARRYPNNALLDITINAAGRARCIDVELGDASVWQVPGWARANMGRFSGYKLIAYSSASTLASMQNTLSSNGLLGEVLTWSAHYTGRPHFCAPNVCGYGVRQADACQYSTGNFDTSCISPAIFATSAPHPAPKPTPAPAPAPLQQRKEEDMLQLLPGSTQPWVTVSLNGANSITTIGLAAAVATKIGVSFHDVTTDMWSDPVTPTVGGNGQPKTVLTVPNNTDAVNFERLDDVNIVVVPNLS